VKIFKYGSIILSIILSCALFKSKILTLKEQCVLRINGNDAKVLSETKISKKDKNIVKLTNLFDSKIETFWFLQAGYGGEISFVFQEPIYIYKIMLKTSDKYQIKGKYTISKGKISFKFYKDENTVFSDGFDYNLSNEINEIVVPSNIICSILKSKVFTISIEDTLARDCEGMFINEIEIFTREQPFFKSTLDVDQIIKRYNIKPNEKWKIYSTENKYSKYYNLNKLEKEEKEVINNLIYAILNENKFAKIIIYNYSPEGAADSEYVSFILEWYEEMSKN